MKQDNNLSVKPLVGNGKALVTVTNGIVGEYKGVSLTQAVMPSGGKKVNLPTGYTLAYGATDAMVTGVVMAHNHNLNSDNNPMPTINEGNPLSIRINSIADGSFRAPISSIGEPTSITYSSTTASIGQPSFGESNVAAHITANLGQYDPDHIFSDTNIIYVGEESWMNFEETRLKSISRKD